MKHFVKTSLIVFLLAISPVSLVFAQETVSALQQLQQKWAVANYELVDDAQETAFEDLIALAEKKLAAQSDDAEIQIWTGIIKSTYAGVKGGLGALSLAKAARDHLETALEIDDQSLNGSAYTSLGTLYANVPGWPIGFGDKKKAVKYLKKALEINPDGIDPNYFYAEYLFSKKKYQLAETHYQKALAAAPREGRELADKGRRVEIEAALTEVKQRK